MPQSVFVPAGHGEDGISQCVATVRKGGLRGGEKDLAALCNMFPEAEIFTPVYLPSKVSPLIGRHNVHTTSSQTCRWRPHVPEIPADDAAHGP
ncbi:MAG: hypothetical protein JJ897_07235 [Marinibacterium sp.]|nr:hypothetical protein [Marinibacterium sp.]